MSPDLSSGRHSAQRQLKNQVAIQTHVHLLEWSPNLAMSFSFRNGKQFSSNSSWLELRICNTRTRPPSAYANRAGHATRAPATALAARCLLLLDRPDRTSSSADSTSLGPHSISSADGSESCSRNGAENSMRQR